MLYALPQRRIGSPPFLARDRSDFDHFLDDLREFISLRLDRVNPYRESKEYCRQQEKASRLHERLLRMLPGEGQSLLLQYPEALGGAHYLETALLAERAFVDGMRTVMRAVMSFEC